MKFIRKHLELVCLSVVGIGMLCFLFFVVLSPSKQDLCEYYEDDLDEMKTAAQSSRSRLAEVDVVRIDKGDVVPDPKWIGVEMNGYVLPLPARPSKKSEETNGAAPTTLLQHGSYLSTLGPDDILKDAQPLQDYLSRFEVTNGYRFTRLLYGGFLDSCEGLESKDDYFAKEKLLKVRTMGPPFELNRVILSENGSIVALSGVHPLVRSHKYVLQLYVETAEGSDNLMINFRDRADRDHLAALVPVLKDRSRFSGIKTFPLKEL